MNMQDACVSKHEDGVSIVTQIMPSSNDNIYIYSQKMNFHNTRIITDHYAPMDIVQTIANLHMPLPNTEMCGTEFLILIKTSPLIFTVRNTKITTKLTHNTNTTHACTHAHAHTDAHPYTHVHTNTCTRTCTHTHMHIHTHTYIVICFK